VLGIKKKKWAVLGQNKTNVYLEKVYFFNKKQSNILFLKNK
jgi:hypothetical protein